MNSSTLLMLLAGFCSGVLLAAAFAKIWLKAKLASMLSAEYVRTNYVAKDLYELCLRDISAAKEEAKVKEMMLLKTTVECERKVSKEELMELYVAKETYQQVINQLDAANRELREAQETARELTESSTILKARNEELSARFEEFKNELTHLQEQSRKEFKIIANEVLSQKGKDLTDLNSQAISAVIKPFQENLSTFQKKVEDTRKEDIADLTSLKKEIEGLQKLNFQLSDDAQQLAKALRSDTKVQGNWGEDRLKLILESEGMLKYLDYSSQGAFRDEEQERSRRPDFIINLPGGKHIVIDSKISLNAYVNYFNCDNADDKKSCIKQLVKNIIDHIDDLSGKDYPSLTGLHAPDFVCMFVGVEPALTLALNENPQIMRRAIDKNVIIMTPTTLIATLKMVDLIWKKESRIRNVEEIFKQCGLLYDKFVTFVQDFEKMGAHLQAASRSHKEGMDRLIEGANKGDTIVGRFERIRDLEAKAKKRMPAHILASIELLESESSSVESEMQFDINLVENEPVGTGSSNIK
jgi:DNA recombination protein RmuC